MTNLTKLKKGLMGTAALGLFSVGTAFAQTAAETPVENTFTLNYEVNGAEQPEITNGDTPTTFLVDRVIDLTVESIGGDTTVVSGQERATTTFTLTNDGNGTQAYDLSVVNVVAGDDFEPTTPTAPPVITYTVDGGDGTVFTYDPADNTTFPVLDSDDSITITVAQDIPAGQDDGDEGQIILVADTLDSTAFTPETADDGVNDLLASENVLIDGTSTAEENAGEGDDSAVGTYVVAEANVSGAKTVSIFSEDGSGCATIPGTAPTGVQYSIPGACVEYRITVANNDTRAATAIAVSDTLPEELEFVSAALETGGDFTGGTLSTPTIVAPATSLDCSGGACVVTFTGASLPADDGVTPDNGNSPEGVIIIRALLK
jgi:uncharacterized repeat protein (TIGR01451 family)